MRLTDIAIRALPVPERGQVIHPDDAVQGFGVRCSQGGAKTFVLTYGKERRRFTIGRVGVITLSQARELARHHLAERTLGRVRPLFLAYEDARDAYLKECQAKNRPSTFAGYRSRLMRLNWGRGNIVDIRPRDVLHKLRQFDGRPMEKRYAFVVLRSFFNWCVKQHHLDTSPMANLEPPAKNDSRERVLSPLELRAIWHACPDDAFGRSVKVLMVTGQRRGEIAHVALAGDLATISGAHTKNKRMHTFPVPPLAAELLAQSLHWSGWGKSKERLDRASGVSAWTLHDLRRTYATMQASLGTQPHIIEALLNHKTGIISGVAATYNRFLYLDEMRAAVRAFDQHIQRLLKPASSP
jgi:integrase